MWEKTSAFTRLAVLVLVTSTFAAAWSSDRDTQSAFALARRDAWQHRNDPLSDTSPAAVVDQMPAKRPSHSTSSVRRVDAFMELPVDMPPGRYRVVESTGQSFEILVPSDPDMSCGPYSEHYSLDLADGNRRHFIRISAPDTASLGRRTAATPSPDHH